MREEHAYPQTKVTHYRRVNITGGACGEEAVYETVGGMTLRDYMAAKARLLNTLHVLKLNSKPCAIR